VTIDGRAQRSLPADLGSQQDQQAKVMHCNTLQYSLIDLAKLQQRMLGMQRHR
jgi:hypothetical protein